MSLWLGIALKKTYEAWTEWVEDPEDSSKEVAFVNAMEDLISEYLRWTLQGADWEDAFKMLARLLKRSIG